MGQQAAPFGAASLVWGSVSTGSAIFCVCIYVYIIYLFGSDICPKMSDCPKFLKTAPSFWVDTAPLPQRDLIETCHILQTG